MEKHEEHSEIYRGWKEDNEMKTHLHGPMTYAKKAETALSSSREEENMVTNMCPCCKIQ